VNARMRATLIGTARASGARRAGTERRFGAIREALRCEGMDVAIRWASSPSELEAVVRESAPEIAFCFIYAFGEGEPGPHEILERLGVAYVGSAQTDLDAALFKPAMKDRWRRAGIRTPDWFTVSPDGRISGDGRGEGPWIVKPARGGNSEGIDSGSIARSAPDAEEKALAAAARYGGAIAERYLGDAPDFREFTAALIGDRGASAVEIVLKRDKGPRIVTENDKNEAGTSATLLAADAFTESLRDFASRCLNESGLRDYARCDIIRAYGTFWAIEANGQPMMPDPWFDACAASIGLAPDEAVRRVFASALARNGLAAAWASRTAVGEEAS